MPKRKGFAAGGLLVQLLIYCMIAGVITTSLVTLQSSNYSSLAAGRVELEAQQWADIRANIVRAIGFDSIQSQPRKPIDGSDNVWEDEVIVGPEQTIAPDHKQKIVTVKVYKTGDSIEKFALKVPLSSQESSIRKGMILVWSGSLNDIPFGWKLCDGNNGTPDLRDKFILGAGKRSMGSIGGEENHILTLNEIPSHNHTWNIGYEIAPMPKDDTGSKSTFADLLGYNQGGWGYGTYPPQPTSYQGGSRAHNNMPPYYVLAFIMKVL